MPFINCTTIVPALFCGKHLVNESLDVTVWRDFLFHVYPLPPPSNRQRMPAKHGINGSDADMGVNVQVLDTVLSISQPYPVD